MIGAVKENDRNQLVMKYVPLVKNVVGRMTSRLPSHLIDREDLLHVGIIGLMSALEKYDASRDVQFETYARFRIRGAILDEMRARDWVPRSARSKENKLDNAFAALQVKLGRFPTEEEVADFLSLSLDDYYQLLDQSRSVSLISSEDLPGDYLDKLSQDDILATIDHGDPLEILHQSETKQGLKEAIDNLPERERLVLALYYYEELTMKEIGKVLSLTESRVCQIHTHAVFMLRGRVRHLL
ncbi:MAG: FliA/WhiG family RNA polymerase sigma factor [Syntrophobacterales bacterium]|nr:FliA/WhiG family RNA polymerase sigma factor [Syntrophobacterales bacterium]